MTFLDLPGNFVCVCLFILGCCIGSFLNVCIHRFPSKVRLFDQLRSLNSHGSGCPRCAAAIRWFDNIPVLGWILLCGRCRNCRQPISIRYPFVELLTGILFVVLYRIEIPSSFWGPISDFSLYSRGGPQTLTNHYPPHVWMHVRYAVHMAMICCLIIATFIDLEFRIIPDGCTVPMIFAGILISTLCGQTFLVPLWFQDASVVSTLKSILPVQFSPWILSWDHLPFASEHPHLHGFLVSVVGMIVGGGTVWLVRVAGFWIMKQEAMGFGDVVLMGMVGSVVGWQPVTTVFFMAPVLAIFAAIFSWITKRDREIPYGPWLSLATLLLLVAWPVFWPMAERIFDMGPFVPLMAIFMFVSLLGSLQLIQFVKRLLGLSVNGLHLEEHSEWSSADHLMFYNSERPDEQTGLWKRDSWPGSRTGQGSNRYHQWRHGE